MAANPHYLSPLRYFLVVLARNLSEGRGHGDSVAPDGRDGGLGVCLLTIAILRFHKAWTEG